MEVRLEASTVLALGNIDCRVQIIIGVALWKFLLGRLVSLELVEWLELLGCLEAVGGLELRGLLEFLGLNLLDWLKRLRWMKLLG